MDYVVCIIIQLSEYLYKIRNLSGFFSIVCVEIYSFLLYGIRGDCLWGNTLYFGFGGFRGRNAVSAHFPAVAEKTVPDLTAIRMYEQSEVYKRENA